MNSDRTAAMDLLGMELPGGWKVKGHLSRKEGATGGQFSHHYVVEDRGKTAFLKAMDLSMALAPEQDTLGLVRMLTAAFEHERELLTQCKDRRLSKVVLAITHGEVQVPNYSGIAGRVFYLIFELADGDVRAQVDETKRFDEAWSLSALRDVTLGLWQVHKELIAHQDVKPSNVLHYAGDGFRIADFGRASKRGRPIDHDDFRVAGDMTYSPPELLYGKVSEDFAVRRVGCDMYMLGNLASFLFTGLNVTAALLVRMDQAFHWRKWHGTYDEVLPYLQHAFTEVLIDLESNVPESVRADVIQIIRELCNPDPARRGHPRGIGKHDQYSLERYVSQLDRICKQFAIRKRAGRA